jgi:predicted HicB family RNase H-like nuclease
MWKNAETGFEVQYKNLKKFMSPRDLFYAKKYHQDIKKFYEMIEVERMVLEDATIGVGKNNIPNKFQKLMQNFNAEYSSYVNKWGIEMLDPEMKKQIKFIEQCIIDAKKHHKPTLFDIGMAGVVKLAEAAYTVDDALDILNNKLLADIRNGEWKAFLQEARQHTFEKKVENFLEGTKYKQIWKTKYSKKYGTFLHTAETKYRKIETSLNKSLLNNYISQKITKYNQEFINAIETHKTLKGGMQLLTLINLKSELTVYYNAYAEGNMTKVAYELIRRRVPFAGTAENLVMGQYAMAAIDFGETIFPPS